MGVYVVTGFISWQPGGGQLLAADGIGHASEASSGILKMAIRIFLPSGAFRDATLTVNCHLPGATVDGEEGIQLTIGGTINVEQHGGSGATGLPHGVLRELATRSRQPQGDA